MRSRTRNILIVGFIALVAVIWLFWDSPERAIRAVLREGEAAIEAKDMAAAMSHVSRQYLDENGLNYLALRRLLSWTFNRFKQLDVRLYDVTIDVNGDRATARTTLHVLAPEGDASRYLIGASGLPELVTVTLVKEPLAWKVVSVNGIGVSQLRP